MAVNIDCSYDKTTRKLSLSNMFTSKEVRAAAGETLKLTVSNVRNPVNFIPKKGILVETVASKGNVIDSSTSAYITSTQSISLSKGSLVPTSQKPIVSEIDTFKLEVTNPMPIEPGCIIEVVFPTDLPV